MKIFKLVCILCALPFLCSAQWLSTSGKDIVDENGNPHIIRGMGLGGWMLQEGYMLQTASFAGPQHKIKQIITDLVGEQTTEEFYEAWLANHVRKIDIDSMAAWGFNAVRLPMHYNLYTLPIEDEPILGEHTWLEKGFVMTDSLISWCKQNNMYVILDLHAAPGGQGYDAAISDYDDTKPSLWESKDNRDKAVALWHRLADRYKDEPWVAGYDLLNEPNWNLPGGSLLRSLYEEMTDSIRTVDTRHILFIEGNWFANDFTGLTPPWDDEFVYSPHKYWSFNEKENIQWVLDLQEDHNVPLFLGESGENSNVWFRDAIKLLEEHNIGWAWWPLKKIESISCPLSVNKTFGYQAMLNYWSGTGAEPTQESAKLTLMQMAENLKLERCAYQKDVIDAMFRQVQEDTSIPYKKHEIPGIIYATDYDMGTDGVAYDDKESADYHLSTNNYVAWNAGWTYRNDGVDIEPSQDNVATNELNIGWAEEGEWTAYTVDVLENGLYDVDVRTAGGDFGGQFHFSMDGTDVSRIGYVANSGGYQNWQTTSIPNIVLEEGKYQMRFHVDGNGANYGSFTFTKKGESSEIDAVYLSSETRNKNTIEIDINKQLDESILPNVSDFALLINGTLPNVTDVSIHPDNNRVLVLETDFEMQFNHVIKVSYFGNNLTGADGTPLLGFSLKEVKNTLSTFFFIPGKIEAEDYSFQTGIQLENCTDAGGGQNIAFLDVGDFADYQVQVNEEGLYQVAFRTASETGFGGVKLTLLNEQGIPYPLETTTFSQTGGWQDWQTTTTEMILPKGQYTMRMEITTSQFNMNWMDFSFLTNTSEELFSNINVYPNPTADYITITSEDVDSPLDGSLRSIDGKILQSFRISSETTIDLRTYPRGVYMLQIVAEDGSTISRKVVKK